jgi:hypothetical protein
MSEDLPTTARIQEIIDKITLGLKDLWVVTYHKMEHKQMLDAVHRELVTLHHLDEDHPEKLAMVHFELRRRFLPAEGSPERLLAIFNGKPAAHGMSFIMMSDIQEEATKEVSRYYATSSGSPKPYVIDELNECFVAGEEEEEIGQLASMLTLQ